MISLLVFGLNRLAPGDPIQTCLPITDDPNLERTEAAYARVAHQYGYDLPVFYFSFTAAAYPDTLHRILNRDERETVTKLTGQFGNWPLVQDYYREVRQINRQIYYLPDSLDRNGIIDFRRISELLRVLYQPDRIDFQFKTLEDVLNRFPDLNQHLADDLQRLSGSFTLLKRGKRTDLLYRPAFYWHGRQNQYHRWASRFVRGDFGTSCLSGRKVADLLRVPLYWTGIMNILALVITFVVSIFLGTRMAVRRNGWFDRLSGLLLFIFYSLPTFWIGTMLIIFFTTPEYGMKWFASVGLGNLPTGAPFWDRFWEAANHLILPVFCLTYGGLAFVSRQMRGGMLDVLQRDYIRTARAKGLDERKVVWKHAFRNAVFPMITMVALILPAVIAGSVIIEMIFSIPGMGRNLFEAIIRKDWNVVYTIVMLAAILTMIGNLVADMLYVLADPRVTFANRSRQ